MTAEELVARVREAMEQSDFDAEDSCPACGAAQNYNGLSAAAVRVVVEALKDKMDAWIAECPINYCPEANCGLDLSEYLRALAPVEAHEGPSQGSEEKEKA